MATQQKQGSGAQMTPVQQKFASMRSLLIKQQEEFGKALPKGVGALDGERFVRTALTLFRTNPAILACTQESVIVAMLQAAAFGLELDPVLGQAYLVPYGNTCQLIIGYKGYMVLARRSNLITSIDARAVRAKDDFHFELGLDRKLTHKPYWGDGDAGDIIGAYVIARFTNGDYATYAMHRREIDKIKDRSRAKSGPWTTDYEPMAVKTVIRQAQKFWPIYLEDLARAAELDDQVDSGRDQTLVSISPGVDLLPAADASEQQQEPPKSALDKLTEAHGEPEPEKPAEPTQKAEEPAKAKEPAKTTKAKPEAAAKAGAPPETPSARQESRTEQATRHEVPRAHQTQAREPEQPGLMSEEEARALDRELADEDAGHKAPGREPGDDDE